MARPDKGRSTGLVSCVCHEGYQSSEWGDSEEEREEGFGAWLRDGSQLSLGLFSGVKRCIYGGGKGMDTGKG